MNDLSDDERYCLDNVRAEHSAGGKPVPCGGWSPIAEGLCKKGLLRRVGSLDSIGSGKYVPVWGEL